MMPTTETNKECKSELGKCYVAGDHRASEQPALAAIHTIFLREHNRIVDELTRINPHWGDERLYQEGRRIMGAAFQHITFNEFLPRIIGLNSMNLYDLRVRTEGYSNDYDADSTVIFITLAKDVSMIMSEITALFRKHGVAIHKAPRVPD